MAKIKIKSETSVKQILELAKNLGVEQNLFFTTTLNRYLVEMLILSNLEDNIKTEGTVVRKTTATGREIGMVPNPSVAAWNQTSMAADRSVSTLIKILEALDDKSLADYNNAEDDRL